MTPDFHFKEIMVPSSLDGSAEPSLLFHPPGATALVVGLHSWSADRFNQAESMLPFSQARN